MMSNNIDKESFNKNIKETEDSYKKYVYTDEISGLEYLDWEDYLDHKDLFPVDKRIIELLSNGCIVESIHKIVSIFITLSTRVPSYLNGLSCEDTIFWCYKIKELIDIIDMENDIGNKDGFWKYSPMTLNQLYEKYGIKDISLDELLSNDFYQKIYKIKEEIVKNGNE